MARQSFWCVVNTLEAAGWIAAPYHFYVPSFGEWGIVLASPAPLPGLPKLPAPLRYLTQETMNALFDFPPDMNAVPTGINQLNNQVLVRLFEQEWKHFVH